MARRRMIEVSIAYDKVFNSLPEFSQLVFLKTLPHTDDFGRFDGDPETFKARVDPLGKKSVKDYEKAINDIASAGLWIWYDTGKQKVIQYKTNTFERINAFLIKQRNNSEYPEHMEAYETICGSYHIESKEYKVKSKKQEEDVEFPEYFNIQRFKDSFQMFVDHRKEIKKKMTLKAKEMLLKKLSELSGNNPAIAVKIIEQSIANGWQGVFELKSNGKQQPVQVRRKSYCGRCFEEHYPDEKCKPAPPPADPRVIKEAIDAINKLGERMKV